MKCVLACMAVVCVALSACGGKATPDPAEVARLVDEAVKATVAAMPASEPQVVEVPVTVVVVATPTPAPATSTPTVSSTPELYELIPPRKEYHLNPYEITEEFDKFTSTTKVHLVPDSDEAYGGKPGALFVLYLYEGKDPTPPATVVFGFYSKHDTWKYLKCHSLYFLLDGEKQMKVDVVHEGDVGRGYVTEFVLATFTLKDFLAIVNSTKVEGRLCNDEFRFSLNQMSALRDCASRMLPAKLSNRIQR